ncbi:MAG: DsbA family oxidoreductase [Rhodobacteraceae bacterium]|jgi:predicted DsbA family dithiol-disulfide isomerase|uniref:Putative dithiol-disulfide isomerase involved in polyketide biosynthesis n=1 Tax=Salipiger profundus TaxID=1229727 RepID=A0A1U7D845_9RHOB|nr:MULTISPECIES: DsbA family oxidoreductase [Salipiger]APX24344.1 putative dithiol-disulfide isomerase involved in polyketide biosynthesis [Salipiger profundus]MAB06650.1 DsbA family oxidoreductase [Paracoccaceae bacterium]GFZ96103.1 polyketide biosynthesis protein [Salipiger profundus]SFB83280.1 Predicted dithiol-disulfide isomerase, DsbA family [Salipiger profundus]
MVTLDIFSDPICPWCYIGKAYLDRALLDAPDHPFTIRWRPFMLNPEMPPEGMDRRAYLEAKFGGKAQAVEAYLPVTEHARDAGLALDLDHIARTPSTVDAHRLIHWAGIEGVQTAVVSSLFRAYFEEGRDIGDREVLGDIADACGLDASLVQRLLASDADRREIVEMDAAARGMGVTSVPTFVVAGQHAVPGAQPTDLWSRVIAELREGGAQPALP